MDLDRLRRGVVGRHGLRNRVTGLVTEQQFGSGPRCKSTANRCWACGYLWTHDVMVAVANERNYLGRRGTRLKRE
jgi:hypothetical protein